MTPTAPAGEPAHLAALAALHQVGPARLRWLVEQGPADEVWRALATGGALRTRPPRAAEKVVARWRSEAEAEADLPTHMAALLARHDVEVLRGPSLPPVVADDVDAPAILFSRGSSLRPDAARVALVGTRKATSYGLRMAEELGRALSVAGVEVVSGLAIGVDAAAHRGAVEGPTPMVAVIGSGHHRPCPSSNQRLAAQVVRHGTVLSEVPPGVESAPWRYPVRNRLIAALSHVVVVVESAPTGGSMSTVSEALRRNRVVMAVPGAVGRRSSEGCLDLLRDGAEVCAGPQDVLDALSLLGAEVVAPDPGGGPSCTGSDGPASGPQTEAARTIVDLLAEGPMSLDALVAACGGDFATVSSTIAGLERDGMVTGRGGWVERS